MIPDSNEPHKGWLWQPKLRPVEVLPVKDGGREAIVLRDPARLAPEVVWLSPTILAILPLFDGTNDLRDVQAAILRTYGQMVELDKIRGLVQLLDEKLFLEGETFENFVEREEQAFGALPVRPAVLAGQAYEAEPEALSRQLAGYFDHPSGPRTSDRPRSDNGREHDQPIGLIAPHIDFARGGPCYAWSYEQIDPDQRPDLVVILGTAHTETKNLLTLCRKDFATPWGLARCEQNLAGQLIDSLGSNLTADEYVHKNEHSVEFQAVWMMGRVNRREGLAILPFLCGSFHRLITAGITPEDDVWYGRAIMVLQGMLASLAQAGRRTLVIASADLSHVGPQFGDNTPVSASVAAGVKNHDQELLRDAVNGDYQSLFRRVAANRDRTRICGLAAIYTLMRLLNGPKGELLTYDQWIDPQGQGLVSFASLAFYE